ncbi:MAG: hypothetical protein Q8P41_21925 [Pseudomonadota bacterium]|nr:hypothetical protein [Pseudomonadota bacterium]
MKTFLPLLALLPALSCAPAYEDIPVKLVGVGYNPDEIGPSPTPYGGVVEYSWVNFAGGGLSLALMGLGSFDEVGPQMVGYSPPFAAVYGFSYVFDTKLSAADSLGGVTSVPPEVDNTCYTTFQAAGPIGSFKTVDVGSWMEFATEDGEGGLRLERLPGDYPDDEQDLFIYYSTIDYWAAEAIYGLVPKEGSDRPDRMQETLVRGRNFPFGENVEFRFPGALARQEAPIGSLPLPSASVGNASFALPNRPGGIQLEWVGTRYDALGHVVADGEQSTCLSYAAPGTAPVDAEGCADADTPEATEFTGQIYTGPWDTEEGKVTFRWTPGDGSNPDEYVSLAVRFLGPVDEDDRSFGERVMKVTPDDDAQAAWRAAVRSGSIPDGTEQPEGRRAPTACEDDAEWVFDDTYMTAEGTLTPALRGDPMNNIAEVTCRLPDSAGEFVLTNEILEEALTYARSHGAEGAVFYLARSTEIEAKVPPAKDQYRQKLDISPIKLTSRAIDIGRFWLE